MMKSKLQFGLVLLLFASFLIYACSKSDSGDTGGPATGNDQFKGEMLTNYADNIIIPAYTDLDTKLAVLQTDLDAFLADPKVESQSVVKQSFRNAYLSYQSVSVAYFGPAAALLLNSFINTFPTVPAKIETAIQLGSYDFTIPVASDSIQGFPALDYLLFSNDAVSKYAAADNESRKKYTSDVMARMKLLVANARNQWTNTYRGGFISSLKTDVGSSIGFLVNQFAYEMDAMKGPRIGWPFGKQSNGIVFADKCESYYSGYSGALAIANLTSLKNYYTGGTGTGISDYLLLLKKEQLNSAVLAQFDVALAALRAVPDPWSAAFTSNAALVEQAYKDVQVLLTLIKTDVASATAVQITYMDNDGD